MELLKVDSVEAAREKLIAATDGWKVQAQLLPLNELDGRVLARDVSSAINVPSFTRSTVDGYALRACDTSAAGESIPAFLTLVGSVEMGKNADCSVGPGECAGIPTGGMLPEGADAAVMVEYTEPFGEGIAIYSPVAPGENTVLAGEDIKQGEIILKRGTKLLPRHIGALAAAGISRAEVYRPLRLAVISTGDEVVSLDSPLLGGQVYDINSHAISALARRSGYEVVSSLLLPDDERALREAIAQAMTQCDVVAVSGGSSQGTKDLTAKIIDSLASPGVFTHGLAVRPGKPTILGYDEASSTVLAGLPGHPVSAMMVFELLLSWLFREKTGAQESPAIPARLSVNLASSPGKLNLWPVRLERQGEHWLASPVFGKSGLITTLCDADGYFSLDRSREGISAGETVWVHLF